MSYNILDFLSVSMSNMRFCYRAPETVNQGTIETRIVAQYSFLFAATSLFIS
jgi:hypothetical protein